MAENKITGKQKWQHFFSTAIAFMKYLHRRIGHDRLTVTAGSMAYVTLLSLVPLLTVVLSALSTFPVFAGLGELLQNFVIENFVPAAGEVVKQYLNEFVANAGKMTISMKTIRRIKHPFPSRIEPCSRPARSKLPI